jgi:hypothetical protein
MATALGRDLVAVTSNARQLVDQHGLWGRHTHGAVFAAIGLCVQATYGRAMLGSSHSYAVLLPWGSHVLITPLWSTEAQESVHDGAEALRVEKVAYIANSDVALRNLRVCPLSKRPKRPTVGPNCGECQKCLRTAISLAAVGALERCPTLPHEIPLGKVRLLGLQEGHREFMKENLPRLRARGDRPDLVHAIEFALDPPGWVRGYHTARTAGSRLRKRLRRSRSAA